jgi:uncharacterized protein (TIGR00730 family)
MKSVCVYCASSTQVDRKYFHATEKLAELLVNEKLEVVFGGGSVGLMGQLADTVLHHGGKIIGIMPQFMKEVEWNHQHLTELHIVTTMAERKQMFLEKSDGIITLPGGCGTFEELMEVITLKRLGLYTKPIVILNTDGYYEPLKLLLNRSIEEKFMSPDHAKIWTFVDHPEQVIDALKNSPNWEGYTLQQAKVR